MKCYTAHVVTAWDLR